jgi:hypothetical protein
MTTEGLSTADFAAATTDRNPVDRHAEDRAEEATTESTRSEMDGHAPERAPESASRTNLFPGNDAQTFQSRWSEIQTGFVDEPRQAVEQADSLVAEVMQRLAQVFADERSRLEQQWDRGEGSDTEALRQALRRYRSFFDRLLAM